MNLGKLALGLGLSLGLMGSGCAHQVLVQPAMDLEKYSRVAVLPFETESVFSTAGSQMADEVVVELLEKAPQLEVLERSRIDALIREQNLAREGYTGAESAVVLGKMLGAKAIVTGSMSVSIGNIQPSQVNAQRVATGAVTVRLIDAETGKVVWGARKESSYSIFIGSASDQAPSNSKTDQEMLQHIVKDLGRQVAEAFYPHYELRY